MSYYKREVATDFSLFLRYHLIDILIYRFTNNSLNSTLSIFIYYLVNQLVDGFGDDGVKVISTFCDKTCGHHFCYFDYIIYFVNNKRKCPLKI